MMRTATICAVALLLTACHSDINQEIATLRAEVESQQAEIDRLRAFVDSQAEVLSICQAVMVDLADYLVNTNAIGMFREAGAQFSRLGECSDAIEHFNAIATRETEVFHEIGETGDKGYD